MDGIDKLKETEKEFAREFRRCQALIKQAWFRHEEEIASLNLMMYEARFMELQIHAEIEQLLKEMGENRQ